MKTYILAPLLLVLLILLAGSLAWIMTGQNPKTPANDTASIGNQSEAKDKEIEIVPAQKVADDLIKTKIDALISLENEIQAADSKNIVKVSGLLKSYKINFNDYVSKTGKDGLAALNKEKIESIRNAEWQNYKNYLAIKETLTAPEYQGTISETQKILDSYLMAQSAKSLEAIIFTGKEKTGALPPGFWQSAKNILVAAARAQPTDTIIHKKVILDPDDPGESGKLAPCWSYESWVDTETGDVRQEQNLLSSGCDGEIDITDGDSDKKLGLSPQKKLAEWIGPATEKIGIGIESKKDPYSEHKENLANGTYGATGTDVFDGKNIYILKKPVINLDYQLIYLDAATYMPLRNLSFMEDVIIEPIPGDNTRSKVTKTGKMINNFGIRFIAGELIDKSTLPADFFDLKVPEGYKLQDWVPFG